MSSCVRDFYVVSRHGYDCLHYFSMETLTPTTREYCRRVDGDESSGIDGVLSRHGRSYSFSELQSMSVTAHEIFAWSSSMNVAEKYQYLLDHPNDSLFSNDVFFICTEPWFGSRCQYSLEFNESEWSIDIGVDVVASEYTCYILLECDRGGSSLCLDWREICDGRIDCLNGGVDEAMCFDLEINECGMNEYRCHNGLCIPEYFWKIDLFTVECLDQSDVKHKPLCPNLYSTSNLFDCEEYTCPPGPNRFSCGDGECVEDFDQCQSGRHRLLLESMSLQGNLSNRCWFAMLCLTRLTSELNETSCDKYLQSSDITNDLETCDILLQFPINPVLNGHVRFLYRPHELSEDWIHSAVIPEYICYDEHLCDFLPSTFRNQWYTCQHKNQLGLSSHEQYPSWKSIIDAVKPFFAGCHRRYNDKVLTRHVSLYQCQNSSKYISKHRIMDNISDCYLHDDEKDFELSCSLNDPHRFRCPGERQCRAPSLRLSDCPSLPEERYNIEKIAFSQICDRHVDITSHVIDRRNHTDETNCEEWPCKNMYTQCDGFWNCYDGKDEENCRPSNCSRASLSCTSLSNYTGICLPANRVQDGIIDCLGGLDELQLCRTADFYNGVSYRLPCLNKNRCVHSSLLCLIDENAAGSFDEDLCDEWTIWNRRELQKMLCPLGTLEHYSFILNNSQIYPPLAKTSVPHLNKLRIEPSNDVYPSTVQRREVISSSSRCTRGNVVYVSLENNRSISTCFCPPNYYGSTCQYQNERVSLTLTLSAMKTSNLYDILVKLIDDDNDRETIHSYEQIIFTPSIDCRQSFDRYLLYSKRPKDLSSNYSIHIDVYNKTDLKYLASWHRKIPHVFLPVNRIVMEIMVSTSSMSRRPSCSLQCDHGICMKYINAEKFFCRCDTGWSGVRCHISIDCSKCSSNSLCVGYAHQQSICVCSVERFGLRCLFKHSCPVNYCQNNGVCMVTSGRLTNDSYLCVCPEQFQGIRCEHSKARLEISFNQIKVSSYLLAYIYLVIVVMPPSTPEMILKKVSRMQSTVSLYLPYFYRMVVIEVDGSYYLAVLREEKMTNISTTIDSSRQCPSVDELLNVQQLELPSIERIKLYHHLCRLNPHRQCFFDQSYMCLCTSEHFANCFLFARRNNYQCPSNVHCLNGGHCLQDRSVCPLTTICLCIDCFFGDQCQFYAKGIGLTLEDILRYEIRANISLNKQSFLIKAMLSASIILFVISWINSYLSFLTFRRPKTRQVGCGIYLFILSIIYALTVTILLIQSCFILLTQMNLSSNETIVRLGCFFLEPLLKFCLWIGNWFNVCISIERAITAYHGVYFNAKHSRKIARRMIIYLPTLIIVTSFYEYISRDIFDDHEEQRRWCVTHYSFLRYIYMTSISFIHLLVPFLINVTCAIFIIYTVTRQGFIARPTKTYAYHLRKEVSRHKRLLIAPIVHIVLAIPLLIFSLQFRCVKTNSKPWLSLSGYFVAFIPCTLTFLIYILPSDLYRKEFQASIQKYQRFFSRQ